MSVVAIYSDDNGIYDFLSPVSIGANIAVGGELNQTLCRTGYEIPTSNHVWRGWAVSGGISDRNGDNVQQPIKQIASYNDPDRPGMDASRGVTVVFDVTGGNHPKSIKIGLYSGLSETGLIAQKTYVIDSTIFYCDISTTTPVKSISIDAIGTNMPYARQRIGAVYFGKLKKYTDEDISDCKIIESTDPLSRTVMTNTCDIELYTAEKIEYKPNVKQRIEIYHNGNIQGVFFVNSVDKIGKQRYRIRSEDYAGLLDRYTFDGDIYESISLRDILYKIFRAADVPYKVDDSIKDKQLSGHIPRGTARQALNQVLFAAQAVIDTAKRGYALIETMSITAKAAPIPVKNVYIGDRSETQHTPRGVVLTVHKWYKPSDNDKTYTMYSDKEYGKDRKGIIVPFESPRYPRYPNYENLVSVEKLTANVCVVDGTVKRTFQDSTGTHTDTTEWFLETINYKSRETIYTAGDVSTEETENYSDYQMVSEADAQAISDRCLAWITRQKKVYAQILENVRVGDEVTMTLSDDSTVTGIITESRYSLSGSQKVQEVTVVC